jgi:hypothetical protein
MTERISDDTRRLREAPLVDTSMRASVGAPSREWTPAELAQPRTLQEAPTDNLPAVVPDAPSEPGRPVHQQYPQRSPAPSAAPRPGVLARVPQLTRDAITQAWRNIADYRDTGVGWLRHIWSGNGDEQIAHAWNAMHTLLTPDEAKDLPADPALFAVGARVGARLAKGVKTPRFVAVAANGAVAPWLDADGINELASLVEEADPAGAAVLWRSWAGDTYQNLRYATIAARHLMTHDEIAELPCEPWIYERLAAIGRRLVHAPHELPMEKGQNMPEDNATLDEDIRQLQRRKMDAYAQGDPDEFRHLSKQQTALYERRYPVDPNENRIIGAAGRVI